MSEENNVQIDVDTSAGNRKGSSTSRSSGPKKRAIHVSVNYGTKVFDPNDHRECDRCRRLPVGVMLIDVSDEGEKTWFETEVLCERHRDGIQEEYSRRREEIKWHTFVVEDEDE